MALVTSANYKTRAGITGSTYDSQIAALIPEAESIVARFLDRVLEDSGSDITEYYNGTGTGVLLLNAYPVTSITSVSYLSSVSAGAASYTAYGTDEYYHDADTGALFRYSGIDYSFVDSPAWDLVWPIGPKNIKVVYQGGWTSATVPSDVESCIYDLIGLLFHTRNGTREAATEEDLRAFLSDRIEHRRRVRI